MTEEEVLRAADQMDKPERLSRYRECGGSEAPGGNHDMAQTETQTPQPYCRRCLTLWIEGHTVNRPDLDA